MFDKLLAFQVTTQDKTRWNLGKNLAKMEEYQQYLNGSYKFFIDISYLYHSL